MHPLLTVWYHAERRSRIRLASVSLSLDCVLMMTMGTACLILYITLVSEHFEVTSQERREVIGSQRLDLVSHRFVVVDHEFKTLDEGF